MQNDNSDCVTTTIVKVGNEAAVIIPPELMNALGITEGSVMDVQVQELDGRSQLVCQPILTPAARCVVADRYGGGYSGGKFIAWPLNEKSIPAASHGSDIEAGLFWRQKHLCGKGETSKEALADLEAKLCELADLADAATASADRATQRIDEMLQFCDESNKRIDAMERNKLIDEGRD